MRINNLISRIFRNTKPKNKDKVEECRYPVEEAKKYIGKELEFFYINLNFRFKC